MNKPLWPITLRGEGVDRTPWPSAATGDPRSRGADRVERAAGSRVRRAAPGDVRGRTVVKHAG